MIDRRDQALKDIDFDDNICVVTPEHQLDRSYPFEKMPEQEKEKYKKQVKNYIIKLQGVALYPPKEAWKELDVQYKHAFKKVVIKQTFSTKLDAKLLKDRMHQWKRAFKAGLAPIGFSLEKWDENATKKTHNSNANRLF